MRPLPIVLLVLLVASSTLSHVIVGEEPEYPRHTPGFPSNYLYDFMTIFKDLFSNIPDQTISNLTLRDLVDSVSNPYVRSLLNTLIEKHRAGNLTWGDLDEAMKIVTDMYAGGSLSSEDYRYATAVLECLAKSLQTILPRGGRVDRFDYYLSKIKNPEVRGIVEKAMETVSRGALPPYGALEQSITELNELYKLDSPEYKEYVVVSNRDSVDIVERGSKLSVFDYVYAMASLRELALRGGLETLAEETNRHVENMLMTYALPAIEEYHWSYLEEARLLSHIVQLATDTGYTNIAERLRFMFYDHVRATIAEYSERFSKNQLDLASYLDVLEELRGAAKRAGSIESLELINREIIRVLNEYFVNISGKDPKSTVEEVMRIKLELEKRGHYELAKLIDERLAKSLLERLRSLEQAYSSGYLTRDEYLSTLTQLRELADATGNQEVLNRVLESINKLLSVNSGEDVKQPLFNLPSLNVGKLAKTPGAASTPSIGLPSIPIANVPFTQLGLLALVAAVAVLFVKLGSKLPASSRIILALRGFVATPLLTRRTAPTTSGGGDEVVATYWSAVKLVEKRSGRIKSESKTHREYLAETCDSIGGLCEAFRDLTQSYELARFAGVSNDTIAERARRAFRALIGDGG